MLMTPQNVFFHVSSPFLICFSPVLSFIFRECFVNKIFRSRITILYFCPVKCTNKRVKKSDRRKLVVYAFPPQEVNVLYKCDSKQCFNSSWDECANSRKHTLVKHYHTNLRLKVRENN